MTFGKSQAADLRVSGVGALNAHYRVDGTVLIEGHEDGTSTVRIFANGKSAADQFGVIHFTGNVEVDINGSITVIYFKMNIPAIHDPQTHPLGEATFRIKNTDIVNIKINAGYRLTTVEGTLAPFPWQTSVSLLINSP